MLEERLVNIQMRILG